MVLLNVNQNIEFYVVVHVHFIGTSVYNPMPEIYSGVLISP